MRRLARATADISAHGVRMMSSDTFAVVSDTSQYTVSLTSPVPHCTCFDWDKNYLPCKHMIAVLQLYGWNLLPTEYSQFPIFTLDYEVLGNSGLQACCPRTVSNAEDDVEPDSDISGNTPPTALLDAQMLSENNVEPDSDGSGGTAAAQLSGAQLSTEVDFIGLAKLQSHLRQTLAQLSAFSYEVQDADFLQQQLQSMQYCVGQFRERAVSSFPKRYRRRIGKRNAASSYLQRRLQTMRRRRRRRMKQAQKNSKLQGILQCWSGVESTILNA